MTKDEFLKQAEGFTGEIEIMVRLPDGSEHFIDAMKYRIRDDIGELVLVTL